MIALTEMFKSAVTEDLTRREHRKQSSQTPTYALTPQDLPLQKTKQVNGFTELALQANPISETVLK